MAVIYKCNRCGAEIKARSHYAAEVKWGEHKCEGMRSLTDFPMDLLREMAYGRMTEDQAVAEMNARVGVAS